MAQRSYTGVSSKTVWDSQNFNKGVRYTDESLREGTLAMLTNLDISRSNASLTPRHPYINSLVRVLGRSDAPISLSKNTVLYKPIQEIGKEYFLIFDYKRKSSTTTTITKASDFRVIDGDTFINDGIRYRLLGIDAIETSVDPELSSSLRVLLQSMFDGFDTFQITHDCNNPNQTDIYGRQLVWVKTPKNPTLTVNEQMSITPGVRLMGGYPEEPEEYVFPNYDYVDMSQWVAVNTIINGGSSTVTFVDVDGYVGALSKPIDTVLKSYQEYENSTKIPYIDVKEETYISSIGVTNDLGLSDAHPVSVEFLSSFSESDKDTHLMKTEIKSLTKMSQYDGYLFIGRVMSRGSELYKGPMSINYYVPLNDNETDVDWSRAYFRVNSYKNEVYKLRYEDLNSSSPNLLQGGEIPTESYFGQDAIDEGFSFPNIRSILVRESAVNPKKVFSQIKSGVHYYLHPLVAIPPVQEGYSGYAYRWKIMNIDGTNITTEVPETLQWKATNDFSEVPGTSEIISGSACALENDIQVSNLRAPDKISRSIVASSEAQWNDVGASNRLVDWAININNVTQGDKPDGFQFKGILRSTDATTPLVGRYLKSIDPTYQNWDNVINETLSPDRDPLKLGTLRKYIELYGEPVGTPGVTPLTPDNPNAYSVIRSFAGSNPYRLIILYTEVNPGEYMEYMYMPNNPQTHSKMQQVVTAQYSRFICSKEEVAVSSDWIYGFDEEGNQLPLTNSNWILKTDNPLFAKSPRGIKAELHLSPCKLDEGGNLIITNDLEIMAYTYALETFIYENSEIEIALSRDNSAIYGCKYITTFNDRAVLYGSNKFDNIVYLSGVLGYKGTQSPLSYFPLKYALDQFDSTVVHVQAYGEQLIVFTTNDIWVVYNTPLQLEDGSFDDRYYAKKIVNNLSIEEFNKNTVFVSNRYIMFLSDGVLYAIRPNIYVEAEDNLQLIVLSDNINALLKDPTPFLIKRLRHRNIAFLQKGTIKPTIDTHLSAHNNIVKLLLSFYIEELKLPYMVECEFNMELNRWTIHDNIACSFPTQVGVHNSIEGPFYLMKNHPSLNGGVTYMKREGVNSWIFSEPYGKRFDIKAVKIVDNHFVFNSVVTEEEEGKPISELFERMKTVKQPIACFIDSGNINVTNHINKRVSQVHLELSNIDATEIPVSIDFYIDGIPRQTSTTISLQETNTGYLEVVEKTNLNLYNIGGDTHFSNWVLDVSRFTPAQRLLTRFGVSGRGRVPRTDIIFEVSNKIEVYRYAFVFKEQSGR